MHATTRASITAVTFGALLAACTLSPSRPIVAEEPSNHMHLHKNAKHAGDYHVMNLIDSKSQVIGVQILDLQEIPYYLNRPALKAEINRKGGRKRTIWLYGKEMDRGQPGLEQTGWHVGSTVFSREFAWVDEPHSLKLTVWVPLPDGRTYELTFDCVVGAGAPDESGPGQL